MQINFKKEMTNLIESYEQLLPKLIKNIIGTIIDMYRYDVMLGLPFDDDFKEIYQMNFKACFLQYFTTDTERILDTFCKNLIYAVCSYTDIYPNRENIERFIEAFISRQFEKITHYDLNLN